MTTTVTFYLAHEAELGALATLDPDRDWTAFVRGERAWILRTFKLLERAGLPVRLEGHPGGSEVVVFHAKHKLALYRQRAHVDDALLVGVRGDLREPLFADVQVLQNGRFVDGRRLVFIPHWPQPGLMPRDATRGTRVEVLAFKGFDRNLHAGFRTPGWQDFLSNHGLVWQRDAVDYREGELDSASLRWPDYRDVDVLVAVRPPHRRQHLSKPATKLYNAWAAGVPAVLGKEYACREVRRSPLDYLEVSSVAEAGAAVLRLRDDPALYAAMVDNGRRRAAEFTVEATTERWRHLLFEHLPRLAADPRFQRWHRLSLQQRMVLARLRRLLPLRRTS